MQLETVYRPFSNCRHMYIGNSAFFIIVLRCLVQTLLGVQGCTILFNTFRRGITYVLYTYMLLTIPDIINLALLGPRSVSSTTALNSCLYEFTELNFLSVGSQLPPRTLNTLIV